VRRPFDDIGIFGLRRQHRLNRHNRLIELLVRETLNPAECSSFISLGTSNAQMFMYAGG
jgi:hypothetical protein